MGIPSGNFSRPLRLPLGRTQRLISKLSWFLCHLSPPFLHVADGGKPGKRFLQFTRPFTSLLSYNIKVPLNLKAKKLYQDTENVCNLANDTWSQAAHTYRHQTQCCHTCLPVTMLCGSQADPWYLYSTQTPHVWSECFRSLKLDEKMDLMVRGKKTFSLPSSHVLFSWHHPSMYEDNERHDFPESSGLVSSK